MLMRTDPFRELDRMAQQAFGAVGTLARPAVMPIDAWREEDTFVVELDLPGVTPDSIDLDVEQDGSRITEAALAMAADPAAARAKAAKAMEVVRERQRRAFGVLGKGLGL